VYFTAKPFITAIGSKVRDHPGFSFASDLFGNPPGEISEAVTLKKTESKVS